MIIKRTRNGQPVSEKKKVVPQISKKQVTKETNSHSKYKVKKKKGGCGCGKKKKQ